jgi:hypothetical protein
VAVAQGSVPAPVGECMRRSVWNTFPLSPAFFFLDRNVQYREDGLAWPYLFSCSLAVGFSFPSSGLPTLFFFWRLTWPNGTGSEKKP